MKIKLTNISGHDHGIKLIQESGNYTERNLKDRNFVMVTEEQFYDIDSTTKAFKRGILHYDVETLPEDVKNFLGIFEPEQVAEIMTVMNLTNDELLEKIKSSAKKFDEFVKEVSELDRRDADGFLKRLAQVGMSQEDLSRKKVEALEKVTGIKFQENQIIQEEK